MRSSKTILAARSCFHLCKVSGDMPDKASNKVPECPAVTVRVHCVNVTLPHFAQVSGAPHTCQCRYLTKKVGQLAHCTRFWTQLRLAT